MTNEILAFMGFPGGGEWLVILIFGLLIFGRRLPDVARAMGKSITEFKKGMKDVQDDIHTAVDRDDVRTPRLERNRDAVAAHKDQSPPELQ